MTNWLYRLVLRYVDVKRKSQKNKAIIDSCKQLNAYYLFSPFIQVPIDELPEHLRKCTPEQLDEINKFWAPYNTLIPNNPLTQVVFSNLSGRFDPSYVPFGLQRNILVQFWNHPSFSIFRNKNFSRLLFPFVKNPGCVMSCSFGTFVDDDGNVFSFDEAVERIHQILAVEKELIIKPALLSGSGKNIIFFTSNDTQDTIAKTIRRYMPDFVCQKVLKNHPSFSTGEKALNTLRVITLLDGNEVIFVGAMWRMSTGDRLDNWDAGGIACPIDRNGICSSFAMTGNGERFEEHPHGFKFKGHKLFKADEIITTAIQCHKHIMQQKYMSWDFTVDDAGDIVFIEMNSPGGCEMAQSLGINSYLNKDMAKKIFDKYVYLNKATLLWDYREFSDHVILLKYFGNRKKVTIPSNFKGKPVKLVAGSCFDDSKVVKVVLPENVSFAVNLSKRKGQIKVEK